MTSHAITAHRRSYRFCGLFIMGIVALGAMQQYASAQTTIVQVEEDWELVVANPNGNQSGPQITCVMSPDCECHDTHFTFEINHLDLPEFVAGGLQVQEWDGEISMHVNRHPDKTAIMNTPNETIRWTQRLILNESTLTFDIVNGTSTTWGTFGGQGYMRMVVLANHDNLNGYDPNLTVSSSGIGFASNRVESLILREVRWTTNDGQVLVDSTPRVLHQLP